MMHRIAMATAGSVTTIGIMRIMTRDRAAAAIMTAMIATDGIVAEADAINVSSLTKLYKCTVSGGTNRCVK